MDTTGSPPAKKRRFFASSSLPTAVSATAPESLAVPCPASDEKAPDPAFHSDAVYPRSPRASSVSPPEPAIASGSNSGFDGALLAGIIGEELPEASLEQLKKASSGNIERAINMYFDGSWKKPVSTLNLRPAEPFGSLVPDASKKRKRMSIDTHFAGASVQGNIPMEMETEEMPVKRYIGAFGVGGWATRSGLNLISHSEKVKIERQKIQPLAAVTKKVNAKTKKISKNASVVAAVEPLATIRGFQTRQRKSQDIVVRFTNSKGEEVGRLPQDTAAFVSTLLDQKICSFEGVCVYAPDRIRTNDTIYLQLRCFLLRESFDNRDIRPVDNNRAADIFALKETDDEKALRLRQIALVKLFDEIKLEPSATNESTRKHKREGLLQAAELAEHYEGKKTESSVTPDSKDVPPASASEEAEEGKELEQDQLDALYRKAQSFDFDSPEAEPADTFVMNLRRYQKQALHWFLNKEKNTADKLNISMHPLWEEYLWSTKDENDQDVPRVIGGEKFYVNPYSGELSLEFPRQEQNCLGGILADEMGLGKTIEMLSLIHTHKSDIANMVSTTKNALPKAMKSSTCIEPAPCTTLVVAPMSLLAQWQSEAEAASKPGTLKTFVYYGAEGKKVSLQNLCSVTNAATAPNIVITSYGTVLSEYGQVTAAGGSRTAGGGLFSVKFFRVILDEGHHIKNRMSKTARACYELSADHRWVLTGTPIVNRLEDLFSLVRFLRVEPWSNFSFWKTFITVPFEAKDFLRALDVVQTVLEPLVLRRTKDMKLPDGTPLVPLPTKTIIIEKVKLSKAEREVYDHIQDRAKRTFAHNLEAGTLMKSYTSILAQILRLRQSCCHPSLIRRKEILEDELEAEAAYDAANGFSDDMDLHELIDRFADQENDTNANTYGAHILKQIRDEAKNECPICSEEPMKDQAITGCFHAACKNCVLDYIEHEKDHQRLPLCVSCREPINSRDIFQVIRQEPNDSDNATQSSSQQEIILRRVNSGSSAKIDLLISKLKQIRKEEPVTKSTVFSQFTSFLDLIEPALDRENLAFLRFDGSMSQPQRAAILQKFKAHEGAMVLLISLRAGGVGLNLTEARRVFMMDPWWSFAVEAQAIDRVHRMGQCAEVIVHRFIVEESVEERMVNKIQAKKKFIASSLGMMNDDEKKQARIDDIKDLLSD